MVIKSRLNRFCKSIGIGPLDFCEAVGITMDYFKKGQFGIAVLHKIADAYPKLNLHWLVTGRGRMILVDADLQEKYWQDRCSILLDNLLETQRGYLKVFEELDEIRKSGYEEDRKHRVPNGKWVFIVDNYKKKD